MAESMLHPDNICPCCPRGCPLSAPGCGRGRDYAARQSGGQADVPVHGGAPRRGGEHGPHGRPDGPAADPDSLEGLLLRCSHALHHGGPVRGSRFSALTEQEQQMLRGLLQKLVSSWN